MSGKSDKVKGRIKEAIGVLIDNDDLRNEGKTDQKVGKAKEAVQKTVRKIQKVALKTIDRASRR